MICSQHLACEGPGLGSHLPMHSAAGDHNRAEERGGDPERSGGGGSWRQAQHRACKGPGGPSRGQAWWHQGNCPPSVVASTPMVTAPILMAFSPVMVSIEVVVRPNIRLIQGQVGLLQDTPGGVKVTIPCLLLLLPRWCYQLRCPSGPTLGLSRAKWTFFRTSLVAARSVTPVICPLSESLLSLLDTSSIFRANFTASMSAAVIYSIYCGYQGKLLKDSLCGIQVDCKVQHSCLDIMSCVASHSVLICCMCYAGERQAADQQPRHLCHWRRGGVPPQQLRPQQDVPAGACGQLQTECQARRYPSISRLTTTQVMQQAM